MASHAIPDEWVIADSTLLGDQLLKHLLQLSVTTIYGFLVGLTRSGSAHSSVFTYVLISISTCLFTIYGHCIARYEGQGDVYRMSASVVQSIGFLGAAFVLKNKTGSGIYGINNAASVLLAAAVGVGCGFEYYLLTCWAVLIVVAWRLAEEVKRAARKRWCDPGPDREGSFLDTRCLDV